jgi:hypothetical protein
MAALHSPTTWSITNISNKFVMNPLWICHLGQIRLLFVYFLLSKNVHRDPNQECSWKRNVHEHIGTMIRNIQ